MGAQCDVIVIGAGMAGVGVAACLASDLRVVLLEQEPYPAMHATGRSAALYSEIYGNSHIRELTRASRNFFLEGSESRPFVADRGCLYIATEGQLGRLTSFAAQPGVAAAVDRIEGDALFDLLPVLRPDTVNAALIERNAYDLDVDAIQAHFLRQFRQQGGTLHCSAGAERLAHTRNLWKVEAGASSFQAPIVVNAAGAWGDAVAKLAGVIPVGLEARRRSVLLVDPPQAIDPAQWPAVIDIDEQFYFKPEAGKILMSPADETPVEPYDAWPEDIDLATAIDRIQRVANIPVRQILHSWAGLRTFVSDRTPVVGFDDDVPGFFWLVGQGGYGIQTSPALSSLAASLIRNAGIPDDLAMIDVAALAPARLRTGQSTHHPRVQHNPARSTTY